MDSNLCATTNYYYNQGVLNTFDFILNVPSNVGSLYKKAVDQLNAPPAPQPLPPTTPAPKK